MKDMSVYYSFGWKRQRNRFRHWPGLGSCTYVFVCHRRRPHHRATSLSIPRQPSNLVYYSFGSRTQHNRFPHWPEQDSCTCVSVIRPRKSLSN